MFTVRHLVPGRWLWESVLLRQENLPAALLRAAHCPFIIMTGVEGIGGLDIGCPPCLAERSPDLQRT
jgi:hypothetical protein